jgi:UDP-2,4-diacetamido-2,4,6-trideoxy-beta-L-altropyranose hydrolase
MKSLLIRTDANAQIGIGHMMRCLALAQACQDNGGHAGFVTAIEAPALENKLRSEGMEVSTISAQPGSMDDAVKTADIAKKMGTNWVVVDGYHFNSTYQQKVKEAGHQLMVIDDMAHLRHYYSDILLNQNIHAKSLQYSCESYTKLLLGTKYVLQRRAFQKWQGWKREIPEVAKKILVTLGGGDPENVTLKVIQALKEVNLNDIEVAIVIGPINPHIETIRNELSHVPLAYRLLPSAEDMPELMAWADLAVSGGGTTSWELAFMGTPSIMLVLAENQGHIAEELDRMGVVFNLGWHEQVSSSQIAQAMARLSFSAGARMRMVRRGQDLVDGDGVDRVLMRVRGQRVRLRRAQQEDGRLVWEWANDPNVRAVSFSSEPILWEQHLKWFQSKLNDPGCVFYIAFNEEDAPIGQVRYDVNDGEAIVSISLSSTFRGKGYGNEMIELSSQKLFKVLEANSIHSYIKMGNEASVKMFLEAGFKKMGMEMTHGEPVFHLVLPKEEIA